MSTRTLRKRLAAIGAICLTASLFDKRWQYIVHFDSKAMPTVEGLPLPDPEDALEHALRSAERIKRNQIAYNA